VFEVIDFLPLLLHRRAPLLQLADHAENLRLELLVLVGEQPALLLGVLLLAGLAQVVPNGLLLPECAQLEFQILNLVALQLDLQTQVLYLLEHR
jgi:hypothetical protein